MRIGELAQLTGAPARMLRYYEQQGLISPGRSANGYRDYEDYLVDRVKKIRGLVDAGIPTRVIGGILPCLGQPDDIVVANADPELRAILVRERDRMDTAVQTLSQNRAAIDKYITAMDAQNPSLMQSRSA